MFGLFKRKRPHVYSQWITPLLEFSSDTAKFYAAIEEGFKAWQLPELVTERIIYKDGSFLSPGREYLRVRRESLVFDIVSAKFGASWWWFSCRSSVLRIATSNSDATAATVSSTGSAKRARRTPKGETRGRRDRQFMHRSPVSAATTPGSGSRRPHSTPP